MNAKYETHFTLSLVVGILLLANGCNKDKVSPINEDVSSFKEVAQLDLGNLGASEISAFDPLTKRLFVVNNDGGSRIDVIDLRNVTAPVKLSSIDINALGGGGVNSVAVSNGLLAAAVEAPVIIGRNASFVQDMEPEYIAVSDDSRTAWVTLQENNAVARIDLATRAFTGLFPLGTKDHSTGNNNMIDASDRDNMIGNFRNWPVRGYYMPDAIAFFLVAGTPYLITANEGDARAYTGYNEERRAGDANYRLDETRFPNAATLRQAANIGRLRTTAANGDIDGDGDYDIIYTFGTRSFSIWNANNMSLISDIGKDMEERTVAANLYDDNRSDDKGVEPEAVTTAVINGRTIAFIGLERADAVAICDVSNPAAPQFIKLLVTGDAPEGVLYVKPQDSPNGRSLLIVTCEGDGIVKIYQPDALP